MCMHKSYLGIMDHVYNPRTGEADQENHREFKTHLGNRGPSFEVRNVPISQHTCNQLWDPEGSRPRGVPGALGV